jgi:hypothetical protein
MKLTTKLTAITLCLALYSCGEKKAEDTAESKAKAEQEAISHESVHKNFSASLQELSDILAKVKDLESAKTAIPSLTKVSLKLKMIKTDMEKLEPAAKDVAARLEKEYGPKLKKISSELNETLEGLKSSHPDAFEVIEKVMKTDIE